MPSGSTLLRKGSGESIRPATCILRSGRAMLYPIFKHTFERFEHTPTYQPVETRDAVVAWRKDLGGSLDYLEYAPTSTARSWRTSATAWARRWRQSSIALERRFAAAALLSGGLTPFFWQAAGGERPQFPATCQNAGVDGER